MFQGPVNASWKAKITSQNISGASEWTNIEFDLEFDFDIKNTHTQMENFKLYWIELNGIEYTCVVYDVKRAFVCILSLPCRDESIYD